MNDIGLVLKVVTRRRLVDGMLAELPGSWQLVTGNVSNVIRRRRPEN